MPGQLLAKNVDTLALDDLDAELIIVARTLRKAQD